MTINCLPSMKGPGKPTAACVPVSSLPQPGKSEARPLQTQLQFSRNVPALPGKLAVQFTNPCPIIIEKLKQPENRKDQGAGDALDFRNSVEFSVVSEEKLNLAVQLAKRDVKRRHLEEQVRQHLIKENKVAPVHPAEPGQARRKECESVAGPRASNLFQKDKHQLGNCSKLETTSSGAKVYLYTPNRIKSKAALSDSPPTHDPGPGPRKEEDKTALEVRRLQKELQNYIQKIEELAKKERSTGTLDPDEERRVHVWRQEHAARSARMLYVLQQQVKEIQEDLDKLSPQKIKHTKKSRAMARLAAAHRGAVRALQVFAAHFANQSEHHPTPAHYKELGNLIRQLSLCSARLEMDSSVPDVVIDLLLQIEDLESLLAKKESPRKGKKWPSASQAELPSGRDKVPRKEKKLESNKSSVARRLLPSNQEDGQDFTDDRQQTGEMRSPQKIREHSSTTAQENPPTPGQDGTFQARQQDLQRPRPVKMSSGFKGSPLKKRGVVFSAKHQGSCRPQRPKAEQPQAKHTRFQDTTIAFRLKETKPPVRESRIPWVPPNPTSPLASPQRRPDRSPQSRETILERERTGEGRRAMEKTAVSVHRADGSSPKNILDKMEREIRERLEPLLEKAQKVNLSLERNIRLKEPLLESQMPTQDVGKAAAEASVLSSLLEQSLKTEHESLPALGTPDLERMLQRMEEIESYQEGVRRRYNQIIYSDPEFWAQEERREKENAAREKSPGAPHPIQITKPEGHNQTQVDIVLERPLDANAVEEDTEPERLEPRNWTTQPSNWDVSQRKQPSTFLSVPKNMLQSICDYGARYEQHLKCMSHEEVGNFNPWQIAESLAGELMEEALADVAAEVQDLCEDYAEAVFTSEFLQAAE
ncbi:protein moonraker [Eublepharis macularius]|uniref:Protein moonraker n=1 Tax=Eublepharis macularius TaxID=481883 RepID=A0AA97KKB4_EUBMA|nr:protein moonraker [Eublepharis macularius]